MFELTENTVQVLILSACVGVALYRSIKFGDKTSVLLLFFNGSYLMGDLYWQVCLYYFGESPQLPIISDLSWYGSFMFLIILIRTELADSGVKKKTPGNITKKILPFLSFVFTGGLAAYFMQYGQITANILYAIFFGHILYTVFNIYWNYEKPTKRLKYVCVLAFIFCMGEYGAATASCFWEHEGITNPYFWFDMLMTMSFPFYFIIPELTEREVES
ncbi:MAG: hypothetical protein J5537_00520 [Lachnospiraceae bacterium]|nr:hypothetical protein [Lachnospiraceae bacterium]